MTRAAHADSSFRCHGSELVRKSQSAPQSAPVTYVAGRDFVVVSQEHADKLIAWHLRLTGPEPPCGASPPPA